MQRVLVVGSNNMDLVIHTARLPALGETLTGSDFRTIPGGKGANQALAAARLGAQVKMIGCVGQDLFGKALRDNLAASGVDTAAVGEADGSTGIAVITVCGGDNHILLDRGANARVTPARVESCAPLFRWADLVLLQFEIPMDSVVCAARLAKENDARVLLNPAPMAPFDPELLAYTDIFVPNRSEAAALLGTGIDTPAETAEAVRALCARGVEQAIITLGSDGCAYNRGGTVWQHGIFETTVVDTTAAGDTFVGALATRLEEGGLTDAAITYATAASAITVSRSGASSSIPTREEVEAFLRGREEEACAHLLG